MLRTAVSFSMMLMIAALVFGQDTAKKQEAPKPISSLAWLVGGVWTADASKLGPGMQRIETRYQWSDNSAFLRFTTHFVSDKGTAKTYDGNFFWNPDASTISMWYMDAGNSITSGPVTMEGDIMQMTFRATNFSGKMADFRVEVARKTNDDYNWSLHEKQTEGWKEVLSLEYIRKSDS
jgi:hypothetical protein